VLLLSGLKLVGASNLILALLAPISVAAGLAYGLRGAARARRERGARPAPELVYPSSPAPVLAIVAAGTASRPHETRN